MSLENEIDLETEKCSQCMPKDHRFIKRIEMYVDENSQPAYLITYTCGHQRSVPLVES